MLGRDVVALHHDIGEGVHQQRMHQQHVGERNRHLPDRGRADDVADIKKAQELEKLL